MSIAEQISIEVLPEAVGDEALYERIQRYIRAQIIAGRFAAGARLPSKRQLARSLAVSLNTVERAYHPLVDEGYVEARLRSGYYVRALSLPPASTQQTAEAAEKAPPRDDAQPRYDFSYRGVDPGLLPARAFKRIWRQLIDEDGARLLRHGHPQGMPELRQAIAAYLSDARGFAPSPEQIVISAGSEFLYPLLLRLLPQDTRFAVEDPGARRALAALPAASERRIALPVGREGLDPADLTRQRVQAAIVTPSHQFPSGIVYSVARRLALLAWTREAEGRYLIEDDYDSEFKYNTPPIPALTSMDTAGRVIYIGSFSKSLSPAMRVSYMVLPAQLLAPARALLETQSCPVPVGSQLLLARFMAEGGFARHLNRARRCYHRKRQLLVRALEEAGLGNCLSGADAGLHGVLSLPAPWRAADEAAFMARAEAAGIRIASLAAYRAQTPAEAGAHGAAPLQLLLGYAVIPEAQLAAGMAALLAVVGQGP